MFAKRMFCPPATIVCEAGFEEAATAKVAARTVIVFMLNDEPGSVTVLPVMFPTTFVHHEVEEGVVESTIVALLAI